MPTCSILESGIFFLKHDEGIPTFYDLQNFLEPSNRKQAAHILDQSWLPVHTGLHQTGCLY